ncbi:hypothetical protein BDR26DRAFT_864862 [Obelidium mucronatum]|nr:hypothetical protein BDR26DRAFT_864862 [Obelidium mucronatum]
MTADPSKLVLFDELIEQILSWIHPSKVFRFRALSRIFDARLCASLHFARLNLSRFLVPLGKGSSSTDLTLSSYAMNDFDKLWWNHWPKNFKQVYSAAYIHQIYKIQWPHMLTETHIPTQISNLVNLTQLDLTDSNLVGPIPADLMKLTRLRFLSLAVNKLSGEIPQEIGNLVHLTHLYLETNEFTGSIPSSIGNLKNLLYLYLHSSNLTGEIPESIGNLKQLERLTLRHNKLSGTLPLSLFTNCTRLTLLYLYGNQISGVIPKEIGLLTRLQQLKMGYNRLGGYLPRELLELVPGLVECDFVGNPGLKCDFNVIPQVVRL